MAESTYADATGINPVPLERRDMGTWDTFVLWADLGISFLVMVVGTLLVPALGLGEALAAIVIGALIGNVLLGMAAVIGADTGLPTMVLLRGPLGKVGSYLPTAINVLQLLGWAAFEIIVMAQATETLTTRYLGLPSLYNLWVALFALLTLALALAGPIRVTKKILRTVVIWAVLASTVWITWSVLTTANIGELLSRPGTGGMPFWIGVDLVIALPISWFPLVADYSRFARNRRAAFVGTSTGYFVPHVWFYALGALLVLGAGVSGDLEAPISPLLSAIAGLTAGAVALLVLLVDETDEAFANVYSTAVSIQNLFPKVSQQALIVGITAVALLVAWVVPLARYEGFLLLIGSVFVPLLGVLAAHYFVVNRGHYDAQALIDAPSTVNWASLAVWLIGVATYISITGAAVLGVPSLLPGFTVGGTLPSFIVAFVLQVAIGRLVASRSVTSAAVS